MKISHEQSIGDGTTKTMADDGRGQNVRPMPEKLAWACASLIYMNVRLM